MFIYHVAWLSTPNIDLINCRKDGYINCSILHTSEGSPDNLTASVVASENFLSSTSFRTSASASGALLLV